LGHPSQDGAAQAKLPGADANPGAAANFMYGITHIQHIEPQFRAVATPVSSFCTAERLTTP